MRAIAARVLLSVLLLSLSACLVAGADPPAAPAGWGVTPAGQGFVYAPNDLRPGETYRVTVYPKASLGGLPLGDAMQRFCDKDAAALGAAAGEQQKVKVTASPAGSTATCTRQFTSADKEAEICLYFGVSRDGRTVKVARVVSSGVGNLLGRYSAGTAEIVKALPRELADTVPEAPPQAAGRLPYTPSELATVGGTITPGKYVGDYVSNGRVFFRRTIYLYADGEYRVLDDGKENDLHSDTISYAPKSGMLMINGKNFDLFNDTNFPDLTYCFYGHDAAGAAYIWGYTGSPYVIRQVLRYAGPTDKPSVTQEAAAKAEAARYKYVTTPAKGLQNSRIDSLVLYYHSGFYDTFTNIDHSTTILYLLLKDGTYHKDLPVAPCVLDVALSRRKEPEAWGRWERSGPKNDLLLTPPGRSGPYTRLAAGALLAVHPGDLHGHYGRASSSGNAFTGGVVMRSGIAFEAGNRFETDSSYSFGNGSVGEMNGFIVSSGGDDNGSYTSASGNGVTVTDVQRRPSKTGAKTGAYEVHGYNLILHYDNGLTEYSPCYFLTADHHALSFRGDLCFSDL